MKFLPLIALSVALASCAPVGSSWNGGGDMAAAPCFLPNQIENFRVASRSTVFIRSNRGDAFRLDSTASCFPPGVTSQISVETFVSGGQRICSGDQVRIRQTGSTEVGSCIARVTGPVSSEESGLPTRGRS